MVDTLLRTRLPIYHCKFQQDNHLGILYLQDSIFQEDKLLIGQRYLQGLAL